MKVKELIAYLKREVDEHDIGEYDAMWMNLNIQEPVDVTKIEYDLINEIAIIQ